MRMRREELQKRQSAMLLPKIYLKTPQPTNRCLNLKTGSNGMLPSNLNRLKTPTYSLQKRTIPMRNRKPKNPRSLAKKA
jgi:hypothetical protein